MSSEKERGPVISASPGVVMPSILAKIEARAGSVQDGLSQSSTMKAMTAYCLARKCISRSALAEYVQQRTAHTGGLEHPTHLHRVELVINPVFGRCKEVKLHKTERGTRIPVHKTSVDDDLNIGTKVFELGSARIVRYRPFHRTPAHYRGG